MKKTAILLAVLIMGLPFIINEKLWAESEILFEDDFSDPRSGWDFGTFGTKNDQTGKVGYEDGIYYVRTDKISTGISPNIIMGKANILLSQIDLEVEATQKVAPTNDNNSYGVVCRFNQKPYGAYFFLISGDGWYAILKIDDGSITPLVNWAASDAINQGDDTNYLRVVCKVSFLALIVNDEFVAAVIDDGLKKGGDIGLVTITYEDEPSEIWFDNLVVRSPFK